jgi:hypothetical protein
MVYVGSCCASTMASIGWKIDRPLHLHSLSLATHRRLESLSINTMCFPSCSVMDSCCRPRFSDAVNIGDGKSTWAYRYTTMRNENKDKNGRQVGFHGVHGNIHCGLAFAGKELADRHVAEEMEMSWGMGAPI